MPEILIQPPAAEPIDLIDARLHLRVTEPSQDPRIRGMLTGARQAAETITRRQLVHARWKLVLDQFPMAGGGTPLPFAETVNIPAFAVLLPHSPVVRIVSIKYLDMAGVLQTMDPADYVLNEAMAPALVTPRFGKFWQIPQPQIGSVQIIYDAGYASPITVDIGTNKFSADGPVTWAVGDMVQFYNSGGELPAPLLPMRSYLIKTVDVAGYALTDARGIDVTLTSKGSASNFIGVVPDGIRDWILIRTASLYHNREEVAVLSRGAVHPLPFVDGLLDPYRTALP